MLFVGFLAPNKVYAALLMVHQLSNASLDCTERTMNTQQVKNASVTQMVVEEGL